MEKKSPDDIVVMASWEEEDVCIMTVVVGKMLA